MSDQKTYIKRLYQSDTPFVPITLSEAVVVNAENIPDLADLKITTLDKVLRVIMGLIGQAATDSDLESLATQINQTLLTKQDVLTKDNLVGTNGITVDIGNDGKITIGSTISFELYKLVDTLPATPSAVYSNTIFLVPNKVTGSEGEKDVLEEYLCVTHDQGKSYTWERLGRIQPETGIDLSGYVTKTEYNSTIADIYGKLEGTLTAVDVTTSDNKTVIVTYDIPADLYDSAVSTDTSDYINQ